MKPGKIILTVISAAAAGLLTGVLFAPEKGNRTRRRILERGQDSIDDLINTANHKIRQVRRQMNSSCTGCESAHQKRDRQSADAFQ
jgi:gas vesicle protein